MFSTDYPLISTLCWIGDALFAECFKTNWASHKGLHKAVERLLNYSTSGPVRGYDSLKAGVKAGDRSTWNLDVDLVWVINICIFVIVEDISNDVDVICRCYVFIIILVEGSKVLSSPGIFVLGLKPQWKAFLPTLENLTTTWLECPPRSKSREILIK